jgi:hypothetical protein
MNDSADRKVAIFTEALQFSTEERTAYLSRVCAGDLELRRQVDELLRSHDEAGDMLTRYYAREHPTCFVPDSACFPKQLPRRFPLPFIP